MLEFIHINNITNEITISIWLLILFTIVLSGILIVVSKFVKGRRQRFLENEQLMMHSLIDNIPDTIYFKDLESKFIRVNKAQAKLLGFDDPRQVIGKSDFDFFEHAQEAYDVEKEIIRTQKPVINQLHKHIVDGKKMYLSDTKIPLIGRDNKCIGTVGITRNITNLKDAESAMLENQAKFKALFDNAPLAIFRLDKNMKVVEYNHRFRKMFGYSSTDDMSNITKYDLLVDAELGGLILETVIETKEVNTEIMLKRKDGEPFIANLTLALLEEGFKEITIEGIVEDITQVAKARDEIIKAKDKAIEADKLKSLFLANMSHEIRTPMNAIIGFTNMLREDDLTSEEKNSFIDVVQSNGNSLMSLIDSIVDFSKLEADQMTVSMGEFNFNPLLDSICDHTEKQLISEEKRHIKVIKTKLSEDGIRIIADRHRLYQVLNHLVSNAIKFTDEGEIEIGYYTKDKTFTIFVRDTGIGIPANKTEAIFDRFTKITSDKNRLYGGTGLGLTISKGLIRLMKGDIKVESTQGKGSTFFIELDSIN
jgi:two-component system, sensor histidine kinase and response regulator